jgi:hypothetical protein
MVRFGTTTLWLTLLVLGGCLGKFPAPPDADGDGFTVEDGDCDDNDPDANPNSEWYPDGDGDGYGAATGAVSGCEQPANTVADGGDCADGDPDVHPGVVETCDGVDQDCNGSIDDGATDFGTYYADADGDGFGDAGDPIEACVQPPDTATNADDCNDGDASVNPDGVEVCNNADDDCNSTIDDSATDAGTWYTDGDGDGYGDDATAELACDAPIGTVAAGGDCDDTDTAFHPNAAETDCADPNDYNCDGSTAFADGDGDGVAACLGDCDDGDVDVHPGADELCDGVDNDCDGGIDVNAIDPITWTYDGDGDGYGDDTLSVIDCVAPTGHVAVGGDCNDGDVTYHPGAAELCTDRFDFDCDGVIQFVDVDNDGFAACVDCDDAVAVANPAATEVCDGVDNDCDGTSDGPTAVDAIPFYVDGDNDGYGVTAGSVLDCVAPTGMVEFDGDCDDANTSYHPNAPETDCTDPNDYNCDGSAGSTDADGDGFQACLECDDSSAANYPGADELCDGVDNNCDTTVDEDTAIDAITSYADADLDGYGDDNTTDLGCTKPLGYVLVGGDCDDTLGARNPGAQEICDPADVDEDCDGDADDADGSALGGVTYHDDADSDGYGTVGAGIVYCDPPVGVVLNNGDCDDGNVAINPGATEICDPADADEDCDSLADDADTNVGGQTTFYIDADTDGFGQGTLATQCDAPLGGVADDTDCDDTDAAINPGELEVCDALDTDEDCDGAADNADADVSDQSTWFVDTDSDGYGSGAGILDCDPVSGRVSAGGDCDEGDVAINPGAQELCDAGDVDEDCDNLADDNDPSAQGRFVYYADADGDGFGDASDPGIGRCDTPGSGFVTDDTDCDDSNGAINPSANEACDAGNVDEDCDGNADDADTAATGKVDRHPDTDSDGFGDASTTTAYCDPPGDVVADGTDCDDTNAGINPSAQEVCDAADADEDCDGDADDADTSVIGQTLWYTDVDGDGYGVGAGVTTCDQPASTSDTAGDCDDGDTAFHPGATETDCADPNDYNCDGSTGFADVDSDQSPACLDCDDGDPNAYPGATEVCDAANTDEDCDGNADDADSAPTGRVAYYPDGDSDTFGDASSGGTLRCDAVGTEVTDHTDCNDASGAIKPTATEVCDAGDVDENCNGVADDADSGATGKIAYYADVDADGSGGAIVATRCNIGSGEVTTSGDCDDDDPNSFPGGTEICDAADADEDCDGNADDADTVAGGKTRWYADVDADTHGSAADTGVLACDRPANTRATNDDCNDGNAAVFPGAVEVCNGTDDDCDSQIDDADSGITGQTRWYLDVDTDGFGKSNDTGVLACNQPSGRVADNTDCDDSKIAVKPGATEVCNGFDDDCDALIDEGVKTTFYADGDGDTYGNSASTTQACTAPNGFVGNQTDCNDASAAVNPGATEICNAIDDDCDTQIDEGVKTTFYADNDADTFGDAASSVQACTNPGGRVTNSTDCDDGDTNVYPSAPELCDGQDNDCVGSYTASQENGKVTRTTGGGAAIDVTAAWGAGASGTPTTVTLAADGGTVTVCNGTYFVNLVDGGAGSIDVVSLHGAATTILAPGAGSSLVVDTAGADVLLDGFTITDGTGSFGGGSPCLAAGDCGAGVYQTAGTVTILDSEITANDAAVAGGAVYVQAGTLALDLVEVDTNTAPKGAGVYAGTAASVTITDSNVHDNDASITGGGVYYAGSALSITGTLVDTNTATTSAGGVFLNGTGGSLSNSTVQANTSALGAGVLVSAGSASISGGGINGNTGSGVAINGSATFACANATVQSNTGYGARLETSTATLTSATCDWGTSGTDNAPDDVRLHDATTATYGAAASFSCTNGVCN